MCHDVLPFLLKLCLVPAEFILCSDSCFSSFRSLSLFQTQSSEEIMEYFYNTSAFSLGKTGLVDGWSLTTMLAWLAVAFGLDPQLPQAWVSVMRIIIPSVQLVHNICCLSPGGFFLLVIIGFTSSASARPTVSACPRHGEPNAACPVQYSHGITPLDLNNA